MSRARAAADDAAGRQGASSALLDELEQIVGSGHLLRDAALRAGYERDHTGRFGAPALAVVRPSDSAQVAAVLEACDRHGVPVVPQGGNSGLVGGGVPRGGEVVLSMLRLAQIGEVDRAGAQLQLGAGVSLARAQQRAREAGMELGVDFAARDSATIGGMIATDAGGMRALRRGTMRHHVIGLEAVLADGSVLSRMGGLRKDNAGYNLPALIAGSEGTLAVITAARVALSPRPRARVAALFALRSLTDAVALSAWLGANAPSLEALDFFTDPCLQAVLARSGSRGPLSCRGACAVIAELASWSEDPLREISGVQEHVDGILEVAIGDDHASGRRLWALREQIPDALAARGVVHKLDVGVAPARLVDFAHELERCRAAVAPRAGVYLFGHLGDGNVHVNVLGLRDDDESLDELVLELAVAHGGTVSAEHGIGVAKARWLSLSRSAAEIAAMVAIKRALDPHCILNPGAVLEGLHEQGPPR